MRKTLAALLTVALLGLGSAFAQDGMMGDQFWIGVSGGFPGAAVHFGFADLADGLDVRANVGFNYAGTTGFAVGVDALYSLPIDTGMSPIDVYVGGGPGLGVGGGLALAINVFGGVEYRLSEVGLPEGGVFLEAGPAIGVLPTFAFGVAARLGFNYYF
jgi:hypothetical protein